MAIHEYVVKATTEENSTELDKELPIESSNTHTPNRKIAAASKREHDGLRTNWFLNEEEAEELKKDGRVSLVARVDEDVVVDHCVNYDWHEGKFYNLNEFDNGLDLEMLRNGVPIGNYGLFMHSWYGQNVHSVTPPRGSNVKYLKDHPNIDQLVDDDTNIGAVKQYFDGPFKQMDDAQGEGVDIIIIDDYIQGDHPDWEDEHGVSRLQQIDWQAETGVVFTQGSNYYKPNFSSDHGTHVASLAAGKHFGMAKKAHIYFISFQQTAGGAAKCFEIAEAFVRQNKNGRPKVINCSFTFDQYGHAHHFVQNGRYRGSDWSDPDPIDMADPVDFIYHVDDAPSADPDPTVLGERIFTRRNKYYINYGIDKFFFLHHQGHPDDSTIRYPVGVSNMQLFGQQGFQLPDTVNDLTDSIIEHGGHLVTAAGNYKQYNTVESLDDLPVDIYTDQGLDPTQDWDNECTYYMKSGESNPDVGYTTTGTQNDHTHSRTFNYMRPPPPYNPKGYNVGCISSKRGTSLNVADFSNFGPAVNCWAFGRSVMAATHVFSDTEEDLPTAFPYEEGSEHKIIMKSGTSMAAPQIAGIVACYAGKNPTVDPVELRNELLTQKHNNNLVIPSYADEQIDLRNTNDLSMFSITDTTQLYCDPRNGHLRLFGDNNWAYDMSFDWTPQPLDWCTVPYYKYGGFQKVIEIDGGLVLNSGDYYVNSTFTTPSGTINFTQTSELTLQLVDENGDLQSVEGLPVKFEATRGSLSDVVYENGVYKATYTPDVDTYADTIKPYIFSKPLNNVANILVGNASPPVITSPSSVTISENRAGGSVVYTATSDYATDFFISGTDSSYFTIDQNTGEVSIIASPVYGVKNSYSFDIVGQGYGQTTSTHSVTIYVTDAIAPEINFTNFNADSVVAGPTPNLNILENTKIDVPLFQITTTDESAVTILTGQYTSSAFTLHSDNTVSLSEMDAEVSGGFYSFNCSASDAAGNSSSRILTVTPTDVDDHAPVFTSANTASTINEHSHQNQVVYTAAAVDNVESTDGVITYSLLYGQNNFSIDSSTGEVTLLVDVEYDDLSGSAYKMIFTVRAEDASGNYKNQVVSLPVLEIDHTAPTITNGASITTSIDENNTVNALLHTVTVDEANVTFSKDSGGLTIDSSTGEIKIPYSADYEAGQTSDFINYTVTDSSGNTVQGSLSLTINDVDDIAPSIQGGPNFTDTVSENANYQQYSYSVSASDNSGGSVFFAKTAGTMNITTGGLIKADVPFDYEQRGDEYIEFTVSDLSGNTSSGRFDLTVTDVDDFATFLSSASGSDFEPNVTYSGTIYSGSVDRNVNTFKLYRASDTSYQNSVTIDGVDITINKTSATTFTVTLDNSTTMSTVANIGNTFTYYIVATTYDGQETVLGVSHAILQPYTGPVNVVWGSNVTNVGYMSVNITENAPNGTVLTSVTIEDDQGADITDQCTFSITPSGNTTGMFEVDGADIKVIDNTYLDAEVNTSLAITLVVHHPTANNAPFNNFLAIAVNNYDDEAPVWSPPANPFVFYGQVSAGTVLFNANNYVSDPDSSSLTLTMSTSNFPTGNFYTIDAAGNVRNTYSNSSIGPMISPTIIATDPAGNTSSHAFSCEVQAPPYIDQETVTKGTSTGYGAEYYGKYYGTGSSQDGVFDGTTITYVAAHRYYYGMVKKFQLQLGSYRSNADSTFAQMTIVVNGNTYVLDRDGSNGGSSASYSSSQGHSNWSWTLNAAEQQLFDDVKNLSDGQTFTVTWT